MNDTFPVPYDWAAEERAEYERAESVGTRIVAAINQLPIKNAETMAKAAHAVVREMSAEEGQNPDIETFIKTPAESHQYLGGTPNVWIVCWESGPYQWAIGTSMAIGAGCGKLCEPYYSFDLTFYPAED